MMLKKLIKGLAFSPLILFSLSHFPGNAWGGLYDGRGLGFVADGLLLMDYCYPPGGKFYVFGQNSNINDINATTVEFSTTCEADESITSVVLVVPRAFFFADGALYPIGSSVTRNVTLAITPSQGASVTSISSEVKLTRIPSIPNNAGLSMVVLNTEALTGKSGDLAINNYPLSDLKVANAVLDANVSFDLAADGKGGAENSGPDPGASNPGGSDSGSSSSVGAIAFRDKGSGGSSQGATASEAGSCSILGANSGFHPWAYLVLLLLPAWNLRKNRK